MKFVGTKILDDQGNEIYLRGSVDACVVPWYLEGRRGMNRIVTGSADYDPTTYVDVSNPRELAWKILSGMQGFRRKDNEKVCLRMMSHDSWATLTNIDAWENRRSEYYELLDAFVEMAEKTDSYLVFTLSGYAEPTINQTTVQLFTPGSKFYARFVLYASDVINRYAPSGRVIFELSNEPDNETYVSWWGADRWNRYIAWEKQLINDVRANLKVPALIGMGHALGGTFFGYQWDSGAFIKEPNAPLDFSSVHLYWFGAPQSDIIWQYSKVKEFADSLGKPLLWGEHGDLRTGAAWFVSWIDDWFVSNSVHNTSMRMAPRANYPIGSNFPPIPETPVGSDVEPPKDEPPVIVEPPVVEEPIIEPPKVEEPVIVPPPVVVEPPTVRPRRGDIFSQLIEMVLRILLKRR